MSLKELDHASPAEGRPGAAELISLFQRHPVISAIVIFIIDALIAVLASFVVNTFASSMLKTESGPGLADFLVLCVTSFVTIAFVTSLGWWRVVGCNPPTEWRSLWLLLFPVVVILLPLVAGIRAIDAGTLLFLLVGYLLTGFYEELLFRGVIFRVLRPKGIWIVVLVSSVLFGLAHSTNLFLRFNGMPLLVAAQVFGAFTHGIGMAALRVRTNTIWPLMLLHAFGDLFLHLGRLPVPLMDAAIDTLLLVYGLILIFTMRREKSEERTEISPTEGRSGAIIVSDTGGQG